MAIKFHQKFYSDKVTAITDPFYMCRCRNEHAYWSVTYQRYCKECGEKLHCVPADQKNKKTAGS